VYVVAVVVVVALLLSPLSPTPPASLSSMPTILLLLTECCDSTRQKIHYGVSSLYFVERERERERIAREKLTITIIMQKVAGNWVLVITMMVVIIKMTISPISLL
jgi:membrane protein insertase Oxa1/YidC/SpoIIIJ